VGAAHGKKSTKSLSPEGVELSIKEKLSIVKTKRTNFMLQSSLISITVGATHGKKVENKTALKGLN
jgi:hypothetical protein